MSADNGLRRTPSLSGEEVRSHLLSPKLLPSSVGDITMTAVVDQAVVAGATISSYKFTSKGS